MTSPLLSGPQQWWWWYGDNDGDDNEDSDNVDEDDDDNVFEDDNKYDAKPSFYQNCSVMILMQSQPTAYRSSIMMMVIWW